MNKISSHTAKNIAIEVREKPKTEEHLSTILYYVKRAAQQGSMATRPGDILECCLTDATRRELKNLGYRIEYKNESPIINFE